MSRSHVDFLEMIAVFQALINLLLISIKKLNIEK